MAQNGTMPAMAAKRTFIMVEVSEAYKAEFQRLIGRNGSQTAAVRELLEEKYPSLAAVAERDFNAKSRLVQMAEEMRENLENKPRHD